MSLDTTDGPGGGGGFGSGDGLGDAFYPLYERLFADDSDFVADVEQKLAEARMADTVEMYISRALAIGVISGVILWALGTLLGYSLVAMGLFGQEPLLGIPISNDALLELVISLRIPLVIAVTGLVFGTIGFAVGFGALVAVPYSRSSARKREINMLLPDAVSFMYALSVGGLNQLEILQAMANAEDTYGEVAREFQSLVQETEYFDTDYRTAIRNQAMTSPSSELSQFMTDMLSIVNSGGDMESFLNDKKEKHMRTAKQQQEMTLETLELFGEMYMTLSLFPLLLIIILVIMEMMGQDQTTMLYGTVYALVPLTGLGFLVLISTVKEDDPGDGYLNPEGSSQWVKVDTDTGLLNLGLVEEYTGDFGVFDRMKDREGTYETLKIIRRPHIFFRNNPLMTLVLTVPVGLVVIVTALASGSVPTSWGGLQENAIWGTFVYVYLPLYIVLLPLTVFYEWNNRHRKKVLSDMSDSLRKLSSANDTGMTLLESFSTVSDTSSGKLSTEFETMYAKVNYGMSLRDALVEFNNKYHMPRMARTIKLISKAQEASSQITDVLTTAAQASENQDDIERERKSRTLMQVVIIIMTYLTLLAVMAILQTQFLDVMAGLTEGAAESSGELQGGGGGPEALGSDLDTQLMSMLFLHAVTMQAILSGMISGYIRDAEILSGMKFVIVLMTIALVTWMIIG